MKWIIMKLNNEKDSERRTGNEDWERVLGHPLRGPVVLDRSTPQEAVMDFAEREKISTEGLAAMPLHQWGGGEENAGATVPDSRLSRPLWYINDCRSNY